MLSFPGLAQVPRIGVIDFYGLRKVKPEEIRKVLSLKEGDPLPASKGGLEDKLAEMSNVARAHLEAVCCEKEKAILYVGIEERLAPHFEYREEPEGEVVLPDEITDTYIQFLRAVEKAGRAGRTAEDLTQGHSLMQDAEAREAQTQFTRLTPKFLDSLRQVLRESSRADQRAIAAYVIGYAPDKAKIVDDLLYALRDSDDTVRGNAIRSLAALAVLSRTGKAPGLKISPTWFIEMLNSVFWTDRNNAAVALVTLTEERDQSVLTQIRERALGSLIEMAGWQHLPHALPGYILLGRALGMKEQEIQDLWSKEQRQTVIQRARAK